MAAIKAAPSCISNEFTVNVGMKLGCSKTKKASQPIKSVRTVVSFMKIIKFHEFSWIFMSFHELSWAFLSFGGTLQPQGDCAGMDNRRNPTEFCKIMKSQLFKFPLCVVVKVWSWALSFDRERVSGLKVSLHENLTSKTERLISRWVRFMKAKIQLGGVW